MANIDFKVKCVCFIKDEVQQFTVGKVYDVTNGRLVSDTGYVYDAWALKFNGNADFYALREWFKSYYVFELVEDKKVFTKKDLKSGMFGYFDNETDDWFVIAGDRFVYQSGLGDDVSMVNDTLESPSGRKITALYSAKCFNQATKLKGKLIWKREEKKPLYNGKVVCIDLNGCNQSCYTVGKIYEFKNGRMTCDDGYTFGNNAYEQFYSFEDWAEFSDSKFIEVKE